MHAKEPQFGNCSLDTWSSLLTLTDVATEIRGFFPRICRYVILFTIKLMLYPLGLHVGYLFVSA